MEKKEALGFLHHRVKRGLGEECREGCDWEEVIEVYEPNTARSIRTYNGKGREGGGVITYITRKRGLGEECYEGCSWEEVIEVYVPNTARSVRIMERGGEGAGSSPTSQGQRGLGEECYEGCSWEEVIEVYVPNTARSVRIMERGGGRGGVFSYMTVLREDWVRIVMRDVPGEKSSRSMN
ncbi:unnamed protein product [Mytilus edulis]|uniref:Uncharacterized protein n=1 Tax=Mytilus edulis TaxID=6550 RepID=A0A8S3VLG7_MYTED|nr:unnamed protein product [Mytilus edulis]